MKRKTIIQLGGSLMCLLLFAMPICAQEDMPTFIPASTHDPSVQSPQLAAMKRHDNLPVNLNTGGLNLEIPLVSWKDKDFECPVSLSYCSAGFRPREQDNYVGRNWMLNVGGVIYRKVNGVPDDIDNCLIPISSDAGQSNYSFASGFLNALGKNYFNRQEMLQNYQKNPYKYASYKDDLDCMPTLSGISKDVEASADIFYFSFGKHSGKFMINFDGSVSVAGNDGGKYKVDLSDMKIFNSTTPQETRIRILTDDGYVYTFGGGGYSSLEYNALSWKDFFYEGDTNPYYYRNEINAYYLTEIKAPNGRKMNFEYMDNLNEGCHKQPYLALNALTDKSDSETKKIAMHYSLSGMSKYQAYREAPLYFDNETVFKPELRVTYALTKTVLVEKISTDYCTIRFHYSGRDQHMDYAGTEVHRGTFPYICGAKLDKVELISPSLTRQALLTYTYMCGKRMFLNNVKTLEGNYEFQYKVDNGIIPPSPLTYNIDHWGFWRGIKENNGIIPAMNPVAYYDQEYIITSNDRDATGEYYDYTLLQKVTYPTGGYTSFEYEPHQFSRIPQQTFSSRYYIDLGYPNGKQDDVAGGARIRTVTHYENNTAVKKTIYTYGYRAFSGELTYMPCYKYLAHLVKNGNNVISHISFDSEGITDIPYPSVHIRYPQVTEHYVNPTAKDITERHPYKKIDFVYYLGDRSNYQNDFSYATAPEYAFTDPDGYFKYTDIQLYNRNLLAHPTINVSLKYGKIKKESFFDEKGGLVKQTDYEYQYLNKDKFNLRLYTPAPHFGLRTGLYSHIIKEPFYEYAATNKKTTLYTPGKEREKMEINEWFAYDSDGYLSEHSLLKNNGDSLMNHYTRQLQNSTFGMQMLPTGHSLSITTPEVCHTLQRDTIECRQFTSTAVPSLRWYVPQKKSSFSDGNMLQSHEEYTRYDNYGNLVEIVTNHSHHTIYLWGYCGQHLVAQIENATYEQVKVALGMAPESLSESYGINPIISTLREKLPNAHVHTFAYKMGIGMESKTSPNGQVVCYEYDEKGRLAQSYRIGENGKREILQINEYHIVNE